MLQRFISFDEQYMVRRLVEALPDKLRIITIMYYTNELSVADISAALGIPTGTVKSRAVAEKSDDGSCEITVVMSFVNANAPIGEKANLKIGNLCFMTNGDISDDNAVNKRTMVNGIWKFDFDIDSMYFDAPENITFRFEGYGGTVIYIPLVLQAS